ncbi:hypothetical protein, conserved [Eimeria praecox]|uniref:HEAT repeat-containing protein n=1 Tax=Eimeria praecox TaxID=51316 RepID=U6G5P3_9EIME|nr:hypothetical protein, conserved [Eimeria praecox]
MDAAERVWQELKQANSVRSSGGRLPLASLQFRRRKGKCPLQDKICSIHQALAALSPKLPSALPAPKGSPGEEVEGAPESPDKRVYNLDCWQFVACKVQRQANTLKEECNNSRRYGALATLKDLFLEASMPNVFYNRAFTLLLDPLLVCLSEPSEAARHIAACLLLKFLTEAAEVDTFLGDVLRGLVPRFGSSDIEGVAHLPPIMRPTPEYKPLQLVPVEKSEEVRQILLRVLQTVLNRTSDKSAWDNLDLIIGLIRAATMDICHEVKFVALQTVVEFFDRHKSMLLHFTEPVARSILSCLVHQHAKIRMGALRALTYVLACGLYKYNGEIIQMLAGWRDPNIVPIKALYETTTVRNYFAELLADQSPMVRMLFFDTIAQWLLDFKDKEDYEAWLFPYLLSGLFDPVRPIQQLVFRRLELLGKQYETIHEKDLRDIKQLGTPELWSYGGQACLTFPLGCYWDVPEESKSLEEGKQFVSFVSTYTERLQSLGFNGYSLSESQTERFITPGDALVGDPPRPCLGTRMMVRTYFRRYANTLFQHVEDFKEVTMAASARLMVVSFAFIEEACVEWLDNTLAICCRVLQASHHACPEALEAYKVAARLVGAFVDPEIYWDFVKGALEESCQEETHERVAKVGLLALLLEGSFAVLQKVSDSTVGLGRLKSVLPKIAEALCHTQLLQEQYINFAAESVTKVLEVLIPGALRQQATLSLTTRHHLLGVICSLAAPNGNDLETDANSPLAPRLQDLFDNLAVCSGVGSNGSSGRKEAGTIWESVEVSGSFLQTNLAALNTCIRYLPPVRIREEGTFELIFRKLQELSAATQKASTRRAARRTALALIKRLILESPPSSQLNGIDNGVSATQLCCTPAATKFSIYSEHSAFQEGAELRVSPTAPEEAKNSSEIQDKFLNSPIQAAAKILTSILLNKLSQLDIIDDLEDTLVALTEVFTLSQLPSSAVQTSLYEALETSGFTTTLARFLQDHTLHRRLFCLACEAYAHECAAKYPDKRPATVVEDMPLGKRRELRLSAIRAAASLKDQAVLLVRLSLPVVAKSPGSLKRLINALIRSLHPPSKLQQLQEMRMGENCGAASNELGSFEEETGLDKPYEQLRDDKLALTDRETEKLDRRTVLHCTSSLPFQPQSHWLLFHTASCLWDAVNIVMSCHGGLSSDDVSAHVPRNCPTCCYSHSLLMPRAWNLQAQSHLQLERAGRLLLELCTEAEISRAVDSCVTQVVELQGSMPADYKLRTRTFETDSRQCPETSPNLNQTVTMAKKQMSDVPAEIQKEQATLALIHVIRLLGSVCPSSVQECIRLYDSGGRFSRRETLVRLLDDRTTASSSSLQQATFTNHSRLEVA